MDFVLEDGTGISDATAYISADELIELATNTPYEDVVDGLDDPEISIMQATAWLDRRFRWYGDVMTTSQGLQWPRTKNYDSKGVLIPAGVIPDDLKKAVALTVSTVIAEGGDEIVSQGEKGPVTSWSGDGLSISYGQMAQGDPKKSQDYLMGKRYPDIELMLRAIGTWKDADWLQGTKVSIIKS